MTFDDTRHAYDTVAADYARLLPGLDAEQQAERGSAYGHPVPLDWHLPDPDRLTAELAALDLPVTARLVRPPAGVEKSPQAFLRARRS
ncbi:hypothetical protein [Dactylosporangium sp. NPDC005555]|uniref:hypothetical protein n=1 Tax=Dactylosporangium sp. NPDC005555 TaxID=3154889 RepID=UPI0033AAE9C1